MMAFEMHLISTHLTPAKDRGLAVTLLRMSERAGIQNDVTLEKVVYCGPEEPFRGWTNTAPTATYSKSSRPRPVGQVVKKKRTTHKTKEPEDICESLSDFYVELVGMASKADGHYHASATIQELYEEYKKRQMVEANSRLKAMVDPVTFRYIPLDEREDGFDEASGVRLPVLKMTHANQQSKLLKVLEDFMQRRSDKNKKEYHDINALDAASFYDKYRWYFKNKQQRLLGNPKSGQVDKKRGRRRVTLSNSYRSENSSGISHNKIRQRRRSYPPTYVLRVKGENDHNEDERTITFERKTDYGISAPGGPGIDRWVARVVMRKPDDRQDENESSTTTSGSQKTEESSIASSESTVITRFSYPQDRIKLRPVKVRNLSENGEYRLKTKRNRKRYKRPVPANLLHLYQVSAMETAKVSVKYDVEVEKRKGTVRESLEDSEMEKRKTSSLSMISEKRIPGKPSVSRPTPIHPLRNIVPGSKLQLGSHQVISLSKRVADIDLPGKGVLDTILDESEDDQDKIEGQISHRSKANRTLQSLKETRNKTHASSGPHKRKKKPPHGEHEPREFSDEKSMVPFSQTFQSSDERQFKSPSSSTFDPDRLFQQMRDTTEFIMKAPMLPKNIKSDQSSPKFLTRIDDARTTETNPSSSNEQMLRKPLHPRHGKNRAQDELQRMIDEEKVLVSEAIKQLNSTWDNNKSNHDNIPPVSEHIQEALTTAIAKARLSDMQYNLSPGSHGKIGMNNVMRRRVVPPLKEKSAITTTVVGSDDKFFITDSTKFSPPRSKGGKQKNKTESKKTNTHKFTITNDARSLSGDRNDTSIRRTKFQSKPQAVPAGKNVLTSKLRHREPILPGNFEASISSIKPERRIANVPQRLEIKQRV